MIRNNRLFTLQISIVISDSEAQTRQSESLKVLDNSMLTPRLIDEPASPSKQEQEFGDCPLEIMASIVEILHSEDDKAIMFDGSVASTSKMYGLVAFT